MGGGPRVVVSTAAFHARVQGSVPGLGGFKESKMFLPHPRVKVSIVESLRDREVACSASDRQGSNFKSCVWRTVSSHSSHHPQEVLLAQFSLYVHKSDLKPDSFHFICAGDFLRVFLKFKTAATDLLQFVLWARKLKNLKAEIIQILLWHSPRYKDVQVIFSRFYRYSEWPPRINLKIFVGAKTQKFKVRNYSNFKSHSPRYVDVQVIFLRFYWNSKWPPWIT